MGVYSSYTCIGRLFFLYFRYGNIFSIILLDLDQFKKINDTLGYNFGDYVIQEVAKILQGSLRKVDTAGRWGGEEFIVILPATDLTGATLLAERIRAKIAANEFNFDTKTSQVTASFGVVEYEGSKLDKFIQTADELLYEAKGAGRNRVISVPTPRRQS